MDPGWQALGGSSVRRRAPGPIPLEMPPLLPLGPGAGLRQEMLASPATFEGAIPARLPQLWLAREQPMGRLLCRPRIGLHKPTPSYPSEPQRPDPELSPSGWRSAARQSPASPLPELPSPNCARKNTNSGVRARRPTRMTKPSGRHSATQALVSLPVKTPATPLAVRPRRWPRFQLAEWLHLHDANPWRKRSRRSGPRPHSVARPHFFWRPIRRLAPRCSRAHLNPARHGKPTPEIEPKPFPDS